MKLFQQRELKEAFTYTEEGGQALHLHKPTPHMAHKRNLPKCFKENELWGHLIDNNLDRLKITADQLGVNNVKVDREGPRGQHVDLCGAPLAKAIKMATEEK